MGAQSSSAGVGGAASASGSPAGSSGSLKAAPFASTPEPSGTPSRKCTPMWARPLWQARSSNPRSSTGDLEAGCTDLEAATSFDRLTISVEVDPQPMLERRPSKMSVDTFGSVEESSPSVASVADSRPSSSHSYGGSRSSGYSGSRPVSASSKRGSLKAPRRDPALLQPRRDPGLLQAERLAKLSLEKLEQQDFITAREAWSCSTPSTASPMNLSRAASSQCSSTSGSRPPSSAASVLSRGKASDPNVQLKEARQRAKASFQALQSELSGSARATPARYSTWPVGCAVKIASDGASALGAFVPNDSERAGVLATLCSYDKSLNTFDVKLEDGSMRTVPAQRVSRVRGRDRAQGLTPTREEQSKYQLAMKKEDSSSSHVAAAATSMHEAADLQAIAQEFCQSQIPGAALDPLRALGSPIKPEPHMLGRAQLVDDL